METLAILGTNPAPATTGGRQRVRAVLDALAEAGPLDVFVTQSQGDEGETRLRAQHPMVRRVGAASVAPARPPRSAHSRYRDAEKWHVLVDRLPAAALASAHLRDEVARFAESSAADVVWVDSGVLYPAVPSDLRSRSVVDLYDLEDEKVRQRRELRRGDRTSGLAGRAAVESLLAEARSSAHDALELARWRRLHRLVARTAGRIVVCSGDDEARLRRSIGPSGVDVISNGADVPGELPERPHPTPGTRAIALFPGVLVYGPNKDGAEWLAGRVAPELVPPGPHGPDGARPITIRLVGAADDTIRALADPPAVEVAGFVEDIEAEFAAASLVAVPLRIGSGTRLKVLEAFAHGVPVVSTTLGAEGHGLVDGRHLLLADSPKAFAAAMARIVADPDLAERLRVAAFAHVRSHNAWPTIQAQVRTVVAGVAATHHTGSPPGRRIRPRS